MTLLAAKTGLGRASSRACKKPLREKQTSCTKFEAIRVKRTIAEFSCVN